MTATERKQYIKKAYESRKEVSYYEAATEIERVLACEITELSGAYFEDSIAMGNGNFRKYIEAIV
jgi:hypothetical protein